MLERLLPPSAIGREAEWQRLVEFASDATPQATLGVMWGRRRIGKSYLLSHLCGDTRGLYYEAVRGSKGEALAEIGAAIAASIGAPAPLDLPDWETAIAALMGLGVDRPFTVVLDEYPYLREHSPELDSIIQRAFGPNNPLRTATQCRLILCGSAITVMSELLSGAAPLRGRAGLDLRVSPFDYRGALQLYGTDDLRLATQLHSIIGGVAAYGRDMVGNDLPTSLKDLGRWASQRVLSPAAPLSREVELLLSGDPTTSKARKINLYHATLAAIASGRRTPGRIADYVKLSGPSLDPILRSVTDAGFVERLQDPIRNGRPTYHPGDPIIRFHYAILRPNHSRLSRHGTDARGLWTQLQPTFRSNVVGPAFESMARYWVTHFADPGVVGDNPVHVGATAVAVDGVERKVDIVVARDDGDQPSQRSISAIGEAKSGEELSFTHLDRLEGVRGALGARASEARLLLIGTSFTAALTAEAKRRTDIELVDLERLYFGS